MRKIWIVLLLLTVASAVALANHESRIARVERRTGGIAESLQEIVSLLERIDSRLPGGGE